MAIRFVQGFVEPPQQCILTLPQVRVRSFRLSDVPTVVRIMADPSMRRYFSLDFENGVNQETIEYYLWTYHRRPASFMFAGATIDTDEVIGCVNAQLGQGVHARSAEYGGWMARPYWGSGLARSTTAAFVDWLFETQGVLRVHAAPFEGNLASIGTLRACGFSFEGRMRSSVFTDGQTMDQMMYARLSPACEHLPSATQNRRARRPGCAQKL
jgi:[ribosomal protein S5]-alanine N-acetyltransferase